MERYTEEYNGEVFHRLPCCKATRDELLGDMTQLYSGILARMDDTNNITTLRCLFTVTFYIHDG